MLKKIAIQTLFLCIFLGCSSATYTIAMNVEYNKAGLSKKTVYLDFGKMVYLENSIESNETLVLLHGFGGDKNNWNRFVLKLKEKYHIIIPDLAGHGESTHDKSIDYHVKSHVKRLELFLKIKKLKDIHLIGNSMGGGVALIYSYKNRDKVKSLILIDSMGMVGNQSEILKEIETTGKNPALNLCTTKKFNRYLAYAMHKQPKIPTFIKKILMEKKCENAELEASMYTALIEDKDFSIMAKEIKVPTLIIWGDKDRVLNVKDANLFHQYIKGSELKIVKNIGHMPMVETPKKIAKIVENFLSKHK